MRRYLKRLLALLAILALVILILLYFIADGTDWTGADLMKKSGELLIALVPSVMAALLAFVVGYVILDRVGVLSIIPYIQELMSLKNLKSFYTAHKDVPWGTVYENARTIDIGVFYYNHLPKENFDKLVSFFRRGGKLRLLLIDPENQNLLQTVGNHFFQGMKPEVLAQKVLESASTYYQAYKRSGSKKAKCEVWFFPDLFHYTFTYVDGVHLYMSPYGQFEFDPQLLSPVTVIDLSTDKDVRGYWENQLKHFFKNARKYQPPETSPWLL